MEIFRELNWANFGIKIAEKNLNHLRFADNIVLIGKNLKELETMTNELEKTSNRMGLTMNLEKTKLLSSDEKALLKIQDITIEKVEKYKYLGQIISLDNNLKKELKN